MKKYILIFWVLLPLQFIKAQQTVEKAFPGMNWMNANPEYKDGSRFGYDLGTITVINTLCHKLPSSDPCYMYENYDEYSLIGRYKNSSMSQPVNILYSPGPSVDPHFRITNSYNQLIWEFYAEQMGINANGVIYTSGNINKMFEEHCKFQLSGNTVREIKQPFLYVGIKEKLLKPVKLYSQKTGGEVVATLPVGYEVEVLLSEDYNKTSDEEILPVNYLVRTSFGLVGWMRLTSDDTYYMNPVIRGLGYYGD